MTRFFHWIVAAIGLMFALGASAQVGNQPAGKEYVLGAGDIVHVTVYQNPDLTLDARISESGVISFPLLGQIKIGDLSISQAEKTLSDGLKKGRYIIDPQVTILVTQVKGNQASILGQVNRPGRYPLDVAGMRFTDLLALAGGAQVDGAEVAVLTGQRNGKPFRLEIDVPSLFGASGNGQDPIIQNGDVIYVARAPMIYIYGEVQRPGQLRLERGMTVRQALAAGGGPTLRGTERGLALHRRNAAGQVEISKPTMDDLLQNGDVIYVRESLF
ncbi:polysaccharide export protein EpsE [Aquabacterium sp.]|uniref:polysaccharide export protein EpsE n=1 Tax=Aquabacterium sp. TaxID=1872578 RepID=UPI0035B327C3